MTFRYRPGQPVEDQIQNIEKDFDLSNVKIPIESDFPAAGPQESSLHIVNNGGLWLVLLFAGLRYRASLVAF